jgi:hypothetical protein
MGIKFCSLGYGRAAMRGPECLIWFGQLDNFCRVVRLSLANGQASSEDFQAADLTVRSTIY